MQNVRPFLAGLGVLVGIASPTAFATTYAASAANGATWLIGQQNRSDGSWGARDDIQYVQTSEAVMALVALNQLASPYYSGVAWLGNHTPANIDYAARRILTIAGAGAFVGYDLTQVQSAQNLAAPGNSGWGLSGSYQGAPLDTALSLQALNQQKVTTGVSAALSYLTGAQLPASSNDPGWALGEETTSDPVTTAQVVIALIPQQTGNATVTTAVTTGLQALNAKVTTSSPVPLMALAALANLRNSSSSAQGIALLNALVGQQNADGSWGDDVYATALVLRALAADITGSTSAPAMMAKSSAAPMSSSAASTANPTVYVPDNNLRAAINKALKHGALQSIRASEMRLLKSLDLSNRKITSLVGLQFASNLTRLNLTKNKIASYAPVAGLTQANIIRDDITPSADSAPAFEPQLTRAQALAAILKPLLSDP